MPHTHCEPSLFQTLYTVFWLFEDLLPLLGHRVSLSAPVLYWFKTTVWIPVVQQPMSASWTPAAFRYQSCIPTVCDSVATSCSIICTIQHILHAHPCWCHSTFFSLCTHGTHRNFPLMPTSVLFNLYPARLYHWLPIFCSSTISQLNTMPLKLVSDSTSLCRTTLSHSAITPCMPDMY